MRSAAELNKRLSNWLLKNWWIIPALIVVFGALAWADPSSVPVNPAGGTRTVSINCSKCTGSCNCRTRKCNTACGNNSCTPTDYEIVSGGCHGNDPNNPFISVNKDFSAEVPLQSQESPTPEAP